MRGYFSVKKKNIKNSQGEIQADDNVIIENSVQIGVI